MRKLMFLVLTISGLSIGCGSSDSDNTDTTGSPSTEADAGGGGGNGTNGASGANAGTNGTDNGNNGGGIEIDAGSTSAGGNDPSEPAYPDCDAENAIAVIGGTGMKWTMPKPFTMEEFNACIEKCEGQPLTCFGDMCGEKGATFEECFSNEAALCATGTAASPCRVTFENLACCTEAEGCTASQADFDACIGPGGACEKYVADYQSCNSGKGRSCQTTAATACVDTSMSPADGMGAGAATPGAMSEAAMKWLNVAAQSNVAQVR